MAFLPRVVLPGSPIPVISLYQEGTAFPTWKGNSAIAAHITMTNGKPGPFAKLNTLRFGDRIIIHAWDQECVYEVRSNEVVSPANRAVIDHKKETWVTLITCKDYNEKLNTYEKRAALFTHPGKFNIPPTFSYW